MCYISMDLTRQALQTEGIFFQISELFSNKLATFFKIIKKMLGLCMRGGGGICADQHVF